MQKDDLPAISGKLVSAFGLYWFGNIKIPT